MAAKSYPKENQSNFSEGLYPKVVIQSLRIASRRNPNAVYVDASPSCCCSVTGQSGCINRDRAYNSIGLTPFPGYTGYQEDALIRHIVPQSLTDTTF